MEVKMTVAVTISGQVVGSETLFVLETPSPAVHDTLDQRSTFTCTICDLSGTVHYQPGQPVVVIDTAAITPSNPTGIVFTGYINDCQETNIPPSIVTELVM